MFKKMTLSLLSCLAATSFTYSSQTDYITYEWLTDVASKTGYTDHIPHWRRLFNTTKVKGFLECGCGYSTAYFLDNAEKVISIEYIDLGINDLWYQECLRLYSDRTNWIPMTYNADRRSNSFNNACAHQCATHQDYALIDAAYLKELFQHFKTEIKNAEANGYPIDVAFVDPGVYVRGDMVKLLLAHKIPIVAAHDTASDYGTEETSNLYGWNKVTTPPSYTKIYIPYGNGTTFWISNQLPDAIASMQGYRDQIIQFKELGLPISAEDLTKMADDIL